MKTPPDMVGAVFNRDLVEHLKQVAVENRSHKIKLFFVPRMHKCREHIDVQERPPLW